VPPTPYPELNGLLAELVEHSAATFGGDFVGAYLVGSFAIGDADLQSDCDFLVVIRRPITDEQERAVRALHRDIPARAGHWTHHLEGSYAQLDDLGSLDRLGRNWLFVDHGHQEMEWSEHCNREVVRWSLYEHGLTLTGPQPKTIVVAVPAELIMRNMRANLPTLTEDIVAWAPTGVAWTQRYIVTTYCRVLYSMTTGRVISKRASLVWGEETLDPRWRPLIRQARKHRERDWDPLDPPRPGSLDETYAFAEWCQAWAETAESTAHPA